MPELLITTGGPLGDANVWRDVPVAVDGWACVECGVFDYPRTMDPGRMIEIEREGIAHGRGGRYVEAEWRFARIVWDWPGYIPGHVHYAEASRDRLHQDKSLDALLHRRIRERMREQYEEATESYEKAPVDGVRPLVVRAYLTLAELAIEDRAHERGTRAVEACLALPDLDDSSAERAREIGRAIAERHDLFQSASEVVMPYLDLMGSAAKPIDSPSARRAVARAIEDLETHRRLAPGRWQATWMLAKALDAIGERARAIEYWREAWAAHPHERDIIRETALALLRSDLFAEALQVNRDATRRFPGDATLWCNRAVSELLAGNLIEARSAVDTSRRLDPADRIARTVEKRIAACEAGRPKPRTLAELGRE